MEFLQYEVEDGLGIIKMARGKANALNKAMLTEIHALVKEAEADESVKGLVLASASDKFYSSGFDVGEVFSYDRPAMDDFFGGFIDLYEYMIHYPKPIVAAVPGHAFAGGAILALACDVRVFAEGKYGFALNEVNLGIVLTPAVMKLANSVMGEYMARLVVLGGITLDPLQCNTYGVAIRLVDPDSLLDEAKTEAKALINKPRQAYAKIKTLMGELNGFDPAKSDRDFLPTFLDHWFSNECVAARQALVDSMKR